jgi:Cytochrome bd terminal oxidase subunit II
MIMFWATLLAVSILLYVVLDGFDLGVGILFGLTRSETKRSAMLAAVEPICLRDAAKNPGEFMFTGRRGSDRNITTRQYARLKWC